MASLQSSVAKKPKSLWMLGGLTPWKLVRNILEEARANNSLGKASELAFDFLFALFPMILVMLTLFGLFASGGGELQSHFLSYFGDFLPRAAFQLLRETAGELTANAGGGKLTLDVLFALWFASGGVSSMISALNLSYRVREVRSWLRVRAIALGLTLLISILLLAALFLVLVSSHFVNWLGAVLRLQPMVLLIWKIIQWPAAIIFVILSYAVIYYFGPNLKDRHWHWITPGSAFGASLWFLASIGFRGYLHFFNTYSTSYGSLGAVMILLAWLYVTGLAFLIGGSINAAIERAATQSLTEEAYRTSTWSNG